ncbi:MAG TPA: hypothetical protein VFP59_14320 [Candidatus Angelobacter sp.]|nr:hypothetical protein [Candidatus Angelobacter sp.]
MNASGAKAAVHGPLDELVLKVTHLELAECATLAEFKEGVQTMIRNLEATLAALGVYTPCDKQVRRAAEKVKLKALRLLKLCRDMPKCFDDSEKWRETAATMIVNYEQFRIEAGHFYQLAVPRSSFGVLRAAL